MSHESPDKNIHWRDRLESLDYLPGKSLNKDAAWDKLYGRLRGEQRHKKIAWYWIAAACSVVLALMVLVNKFTNKPGASNVETTVKHSKKVNNPVPVPLTDKISSDKNAIVTAQPKDESITASRKSVQGKRHVRVVEVTQAVIPVNTTNPNLENAASTQSLPITNDNLTAAQAPPTKKKLNVVHINELGDPVIEDPDIVRNHGKHKLKFGTGEVYANSTTGYQTNEYNLLTAKL